MCVCVCCACVVRCACQNQQWRKDPTDRPPHTLTHKLTLALAHTTLTHSRDTNDTLCWCGGRCCSLWCGVLCLAFCLVLFPCFAVCLSFVVGSGAFVVVELLLWLACLWVTATLPVPAPVCEAWLYCFFFFFRTRATTNPVLPVRMVR